MLYADSTLGGNGASPTKRYLRTIPVLIVRLAHGFRNRGCEGSPDHLGQQLEEQAGEDQLWLGRRVKIIDGTSVSMPDTAANQELWPQSSAQKPGCGFPLLKLLGVFSLQSGALLDLTISNHRRHDAQLARQLCPNFQAGDVVLADRGFCSFGDLAQLHSAGIDVVMRLHQSPQD